MSGLFARLDRLDREVSHLAIEVDTINDRARPGAKQSRAMSLVESVANVAVGYGVAVATQLVVFPWFGIAVSLADNLAIGLAFTVVSLIRSFALRRAFEAIRVRAARRGSGAR